MRFSIGSFHLLLLSTAAAKKAAFQTQPASKWGIRMDAPDDYMQDMLSEMMKHNTNYDLSFNNSPTSKIPELLQSMQRNQEKEHISHEAAHTQAKDLVAPWPNDDGMRDTASEWDVLGTNYDYSYNNSPTNNRCQVKTKNEPDWSEQFCIKMCY